MVHYSQLFVSSMSSVVLFTELQGFQPITDEEKIQTIAFLSSAKEVIQVVGKYLIYVEDKVFHCCLG